MSRAVFALALFSALAGCLGDDGVRVDVEDNHFAPNALDLEAGTSVLFVNEGRATHTVTVPDPRDADAPPLVDVGLAPTEELRHAFAEAGNYVVYCRLHGTPDVAMRMTVVVR